MTVRLVSSHDVKSSRFISPSKILLVLFLISSFHTFVFAANTPDKPFAAAVIRAGKYPGVRMMSGLTVCEEELRNGRLISRYWNSSGQIVPDAYLDGDRWITDMLPADAFKLEIEKQELSGTWKWVRADKSESQNG